VGLVFAVHLGLIFAFGSRKPVVPRAVGPVPAVQMASRLTELQLLDDPTLFARPHTRGFAGNSWLRVPPHEFPPFRWTEPPRLLDLPVAQLGAVFLRHVQTNRSVALALNVLPVAQPTQLPPSETSAPARRTSSYRVRGGLAARRWLNPPTDLPSWPAPDPLTNTVVQVLADAQGQVISPIVLPPGSGSKAADARALEVAREARFAPVKAAPPTVGVLIFEWSTALPAGETNAAAGKP
jgi:hypothetical protein